MSVNNDDKKEEKHHPSAAVKEPQVPKGEVTIKEDEYKRLLEDASKHKECPDKILRLQADFENVRKRMEKQAQDFTKYATEGIILELLNILDDLERTVQVAGVKDIDPQAFMKGVEMILAHLYEMLKEHGVKPFEVEGKIFDPHTSEALTQAESDLPEGTVIEEMQKGYWLNEKVIRTAKVKVACAKKKI